MKTIEEKVADTLLERTTTIELGGRKVTIQPPTTATLIMASEQISQLPTMDGENIVGEVLSKAKDARAIGKAFAIMLIGAKRVKACKKVRIGLFKRISEVEWLTDYLLENLTIEELARLMSERLTQMQLGDFFAITTSLSAANVIKPTKEVETAFGE